jgi:DNA-binding NarL/FixJ family response regulator
MRERARAAAKRDLREALSRYLETERAPGASLAGTLAADRPSPLGMLTAREGEIARCAAEGLQDKEIAARLGISARTVSNTMIRIYRKAGLENRLALIRRMGESPRD